MINQTILCVLLAACLAALSAASYRALIKPLGHDEAVLLQAADSLSKGDGYASYGATRGDGPRLFDPHITVGPVTLVPLSVIWRLTSGDVTAVRAFMLAISYLYIAGLFCLFHTKRYGLLLPVLSISSFLSIADLPVGAIQGELAAATALVWSAYAIRKRRILTAALLAGLAVQIKLVFVLAGAVLLSVWIIPAFFPNGRFNLKRFPSAIAAGLIFSAPTLVFELWRFLSFADINSWMASLDEFKYFLRSQNINTTSSWLDNQVLREKLWGFYQRYPLSAWIAATTATLLILVWAILRRHAVKLRRATLAAPSPSYASQTHQKKVAENQFPLAIAAGLIVCGAAMLVGWVTQSAQIGNRQSLPFFFLLIPPLFALSGYCYCQATSWMSNTFSAPLLPQWRMLFSSIPICVVLLAVALAGRVSDIIQYEIAKDQRRREEQNLVLSIIREQNAESLFVDINASGLWQNAVFQLLSPIQAIPMKTGEDQLMIVSTYGNL